MGTSPLLEKGHLSYEHPEIDVTWLLNGSLLMFPSNKHILLAYQNMHRVT